MESGLHPATTMREQLRAQRNLPSTYAREGETRMESGAQPQTLLSAELGTGPALTSGF